MAIKINYADSKVPVENRSVDKQSPVGPRVSEIITNSSVREPASLSGRVVSDIFNKETAPKVEKTALDVAKLIVAFVLCAGLSFAIIATLGFIVYIPVLALATMAAVAKIANQREGDRDDSGSAEGKLLEAPEATAKPMKSNLDEASMAQKTPMEQLIEAQSRSELYTREKKAFAFYDQFHHTEEDLERLRHRR